MRTLVVLSLTLLTLTACGGTGSDKIDISGNKNIDAAIEAATGPLQDLNLRQQPIPALLVAAANNPYSHKKIVRCDEVKSEVAQLDELLGPDITPNDMTLASANEGLVDHISNVGGDISDSITGSSGSGNGISLPDSDTLFDTAGEYARDGVMGMIHSHTSFLPFRGIIRKITGAESHQKKLATAYEAGKLRRAYLKGLAEVHFGPKCLANPIMVEAKPTTIEAKADITPSIPTGIAH